MEFKVGDTVQLKEKFAGRRCKGKIQKIMVTEQGRILVVIQPNNLTANFPEYQWEKVKEERDD